MGWGLEVEQADDQLRLAEQRLARLGRLGYIGLQAGHMRLQAGHIGLQAG